jgi:hypothetical protein
MNDRQGRRRHRVVVGRIEGVVKIDQARGLVAVAAGVVVAGNNGDRPAGPWKSRRRGLVENQARIVVVNGAGMVSSVGRPCALVVANARRRRARTEVAFARHRPRGW